MSAHHNYPSDTLQGKLEAIGFRQDEFGAWHLRGYCDVCIYSACGEWELDIVTDRGSLGCDTPRIEAGPVAKEGAA